MEAGEPVAALSAARGVRWAVGRHGSREIRRRLDWCVSLRLRPAVAWGMSTPLPGAVTGAPRLWLRLEGVAVLALAVLLYQRGGHSWLLFAIAFLAPDLSFAAYLAGPRVGALGYNVAHSYVGPLLAATLALLAGWSPGVALLWAAHIGFDRTLGYGLKYATGFTDTHLGRLGRPAGHATPADE